MAFRSRKVALKSIRLLLGSALIASLVVGLLGCTQQTGVISSTNMDPTMDRESFLKARLQHNYANPVAHCELGKYYLSEKQWDKAKFHIDAALDCDPAHRNSQAAQLKLHSEMGDTQTTQTLFSKYHHQLFNSPDEMTKLAKALGEEGLDEFALNCFNQALRRQPDSAETNKYLGYFYLYRNKPEKAKAYFSKSFEIDANQPGIAGELGRMGIVIETNEPEPVDINVEKPAN
jgi:tetratricopeptide (TPR) repeat protein